MNHDYLPQGFAALSSWLINFFEYLLPNLVRFKIQESETTDVQAKADDYQTAHLKAEHPNAGKADRLDRKEKAEVTVKTVREFVNEHLRFNKSVTDNDRVQLGLHVADHHPTPHARPDTWPLPTIRTAGPRQLRLDWHDSTTKTKAKPAGVRSCEICYAILDTPPTTNADLVHSVFSTHSFHLFTFDESQRRKNIYFILRWENTRGETGVFSEMISASIP